MKKILVLTFAAVLALAGCEKVKETNSNKAVVINNNTSVTNTNMTNAVATNTNTTTGKVMYDKEVTREQYDKDKDKYVTDAKQAGSTIGQGAEDGWLWTKVKTALATTAGVRDSTVNVDVENNVVILRGTVATKEEMEKAVKSAQEVKDVKSVKNMIQVKPNDSITNQMVNGNSAMKSNANMKSNSMK